jgi:biopolymer transport protein ExbD
MSRIDSINQMLGEEEEAKIDLTPMLDVVFIMLIFFIVTASFVKELALDVNKPPDQNVMTSSKNDSVTIVIRANDEIAINGLTVDKRAVAAQIIRAKAERSRVPTRWLASLIPSRKRALTNLCPLTNSRTSCSAEPQPWAWNR